MADLSGGEMFEEAMDRIRESILKASVVKVGFLEGATYPDGTPVAEVAALNNFGAPAAGIPARPFFTNMIVAKSPAWGEKFARVLQAAEYDVELALARMGEGIAGQLRQSIVDTNTPENAPATIAKKGFDDPLVETGHMLASVDKEVEQ